MSKQEKLLAKIRNNPKAVTFEELEAVLEWHSFVLKRVKGSHHVYTRGPHVIVVAKHKPYVHSKAVKDALSIIDELLEPE